jgi:FtsZ-interacting cell division protein ZipA
MSSTALILIVVVVVAAIVVLFVGYASRKRALLRARFGPEYDRALKDVGTPRKADALLDARARRVSRYTIRPLTPEEHERFSTAWQRLQARFVDDPAGAVAEADVLVADLMDTRGYPTSDFDHRAEDVSVDHPDVVQHYREAHAIAVDHARGGTSTEELRKAIVHYRAIFDDLLDVQERVRKPA